MPEKEALRRKPTAPQSLAPKISASTQASELSVGTTRTTHSTSPPIKRGTANGLLEELSRIRKLVGDARAGKTPKLPASARFLADGRVLCEPRKRGVSRYPYGRDGFNFWVYSSGIMHANNGLFYLFLPPSEGKESAIAFYAGVRNKNQQRFRPVSLLPTPHIGDSADADIDRFCVLGHDAAYFLTSAGALSAGIRVFVEQSANASPRIYFSVLLTNRHDQDREVYLSSFMNPFARHQFAETYEDRWFRKSKVCGPPRARMFSREDEICLPPFLLSVNEDRNRTQSTTNFVLIRRTTSMNTSAGDAHPVELISEICTSRVGYTGCVTRDLSNPHFLTSGQFDHASNITAFSEMAVAADLGRVTLPAGASLRADYLLQTCSDEPTVQADAATPISSAQIDRAWLKMRRSAQAPPDGVKLASWQSDGPIDDKTFNHFYEYVRKQVEICATTNGYMHPSPNSLIGVRDVMQAVEALLYDQPETARCKLLETLSFVLPDGRCPRQYSLPANGKPGRADLREFIDQGAWVIATVHTYVRVTGNREILDAKVGYHQTCEGLSDSLTPAQEIDAVWQHLVRIMGYMDRHRDHATQLLRAMYGDWNDALDGLGTTTTPNQRFGTGVSVMASLQLYQNCTHMIELLKLHDPSLHEVRIREYEALRRTLRNALLDHAVVRRNGQSRILHGWGDRREYVVGGFEDCDGESRDGLTSNAFWVISGMLESEPSLHGDILSAMLRLDSKYGLKTFEPGFGPTAPGVGRIPKLPMGTAENGAVYVHATLFGAHALFQMGQPRLAWEQIEKVLPIAPHQKGLTHSPFVMPNSYALNRELNLDGQNMNDWQTGSSNVLIKILIRCICGFEPGFDSLRIAPASWIPFKRIEFEATAHGRRVRLVLSRGATSRQQFALNGKRIANTTHDPNMNLTFTQIPYSSLKTKGVNTIAITIPHTE